MNISTNENEITLSAEGQAEMFQLEILWTEISKNHKCKKLLDGWKLIGIQFLIEKHDSCNK